MLSVILCNSAALRCEDGWLAWQDHCYYVSFKNDRRTWFDARSYCLSQGADLASILTEGENSYIESVIYQAGIRAHLNKIKHQFLLE